MLNDKEKRLENYNYIWDRYSVYSTNPNQKVTSRGYDSEKCQKARCDLDGAMKFLYTDGKGKTRGNYISNPALRDAKISICKIGKKNYLTDDGAIFKELSARGMKKAKIMKLLRMVDSDYDIQILNNELCMEIEDPGLLTDCYRNMANVMIKIKCLAEAHGI